MDKKTILIVDDNADTRLVLSSRLKANHYHIVFATDALQAMSVSLMERPKRSCLIWVFPAGTA